MILHHSQKELIAALDPPPRNDAQRLFVIHEADAGIDQPPDEAMGRLNFEKRTPGSEKGCTDEGVLRILIHRYRQFQKAPMQQGRPVDKILDHLEEALNWMEHEKRERP